MDYSMGLFVMYFGTKKKYESIQLPSASGWEGHMEKGPAVHNVLFVQYLLLATEQVGSYFKSCILLYHLTYIYPNSFGCEQNIL